ncbi:hypothetical protein HELRODRAFT_165074 [Helobdella robusta]|uniref:Uncharacterized protein n=1 Tax=Helobdella robusta TaxID=6412 RepID=T1EW93_HELRO|nr:hypothetical protein HELRODRAFT_165074 [Helobdella robusta]ESN92936.1 hypothetical protein HELRODRAFT_165074 [Helobdella robusta]
MIQDQSQEPSNWFPKNLLLSIADGDRPDIWIAELVNIIDINYYSLERRIFDPKTKCTAYNSAILGTITRYTATTLPCVLPAKRSPIFWKTLNGQEVTISRKYATVEGCCEKLNVLLLEYQTWHFKYYIAYWTLHGDCQPDEKAKDAVRKTPSSEIPLICGHARDKANGFHGVHGGFGSGSQNEDGVRILEFANEHELSLLNTYFKKRAEHLITYKS